MTKPKVEYLPSRIEGVKVKKLRVIPDERGRLTEILRSDDEIFQKFGQTYVTTVYPGVVKGWHYHKKQTDNFAVIKGTVKIVLFDDRRDSSSYGQVEQWFAGEHLPVLLQVPPLVVHGFKGVGLEEALVVNLPTELYVYDEPDEFRIDPHDNDIPYDWNRKDG